LRKEVELAQDQMFQMAKEFDETKEKLERKVNELRSFISDLQVRVESAEREAGEANAQREHAENLLLKMKHNNTSASSQQPTKPSQQEANEKHQQQIKTLVKKISDLETTLQNQQEEHRKRMKRQIKLESELEQAKSSLQTSLVELEKQQQRYNLLLPQVETLALQACEARNIQPGQQQSQSDLLDKNKKNKKSVTSSVQHYYARESLARDNNDDDDDNETSSSSSQDSDSDFDLPSTTTKKPGDASLIFMFENTSLVTDSVPNSSPPSRDETMIVVPESKNNKNKKDHEKKKTTSSRKGRSISPQPKLPPVHPNTARTSSSSNKQTTRSQSNSQNPNIEATPINLVQGANPLFQVQFVSAVLKKLATIASSSTQLSSSSQLASFHQQKQIVESLETQNQKLKQQLGEVQTRLSVFQMKTNEQHQLLQSEHEHALKEQESASSLASQLRQMTEELVSQQREKKQYELAVKNLQNRLEQESFVLAEMKCDLEEAKKSNEKLTSQLAKSHAEKFAAETQLKNERESASKAKAELDAVKKFSDENKDKFEKHKELLQNSLRKEQRRYTKALQHADKLETKLIATQTEIGALTSKLKNCETDIATKLRQIQSLERDRKDAAIKVQRTEAKLSAEDELCLDFARIAANYDQAISAFSDFVYSKTDFRCVPWDLACPPAPLSSEATKSNSPQYLENLLETTKERSEIVSQLLSEFADFSIEHVKMLRRAEQQVKIEKEKVEFLNAEMEVYFHESNNNNNKKSAVEKLLLDDDDNKEDEDVDISLVELMMEQQTSKSRENNNSSSVKKSKSKSGSSSKRRKHHSHKRSSGLLDSEGEVDVSVGTPPRSLFL
jgi:hypothetical protein